MNKQINQQINQQIQIYIIEFELNLFFIFQIQLYIKLNTKSNEK